MAVAVPDILARIVDHKRSQLARASAHRADLERRAADRPVARDFRGALIASPPAIIAEIKQASPSKGVFTDDFHPASIAKLYEAGDAAALSILPDEEFFKGKLADIEAARTSLGIPRLRKDFPTDELHHFQAPAHRPPPGRGTGDRGGAAGGRAIRRRSPSEQPATEHYSYPREAADDRHFKAVVHERLEVHGHSSGWRRPSGRRAPATDHPSIMSDGADWSHG